MTSKMDYGELVEISMALMSEWRRVRKEHARAIRQGDAPGQQVNGDRLIRLYSAYLKIQKTIERNYE